jgi:Uma2 family endonuclease
MNASLAVSQTRETPARFTAREFLRMGELGAFDGMKVELVAGEIIRMTPPYAGHGARQAQLIVALHQAYRDAAVVVAGETGIQLDRDTVRAADIVVFRADVRDSQLLSPQDIVLVVEIADASLDRDLGPKCRDYANAFVPEYWVADMKGRVIHVMRDPRDGDYARREVVRFGQDILPPAGGAAFLVD